MENHTPQPEPLDPLVDAVVQSYHADDRTHHLDATYLPSRSHTVRVVEMLRKLFFPGFFDDQRVTSQNVRFHVGELLSQIREALYEQVRQALRYEANRKQDGHGDACENCDTKANLVTRQFLERIPELRRLLALDVQAAFEGDPAAVSTDETIFCYPGVDAIFLHRIAHELHKLEVPLLPRIISEYAHNETGIDIHPGATIGESFFIDHGSGVVIGETTTIGNRVKIYQNVTLGALSTKGGQQWRGRKRHPTIEDDATIYGGAVILGGATVIGQGATVGGAVFLTTSVPPGYTVTMKAPELTMTEQKKRPPKPSKTP
ncbi:MAG: serine acetyltransferase [Phycisphaera sp.]|nr:serine acetyltransferase [Phycisphaera sp.]